MSAYLIYHSDTRLVSCEATKPSTHTAGRKVKGVLAGQISIWSTSDARAEDVEFAAQVFERRLDGDLIGDIVKCRDQLVTHYGADSLFVAVGASPKMVKWLLKRQGLKAITINVSGVTSKAEATSEFVAYLKRKLSSYQDVRKIVVMDYADTGVSLYKLKRDIGGIRTDATVRTVAIGSSGKIDKPVNDAFRKDLDYTVTDIQRLSKLLLEQSLKLELLGRNKVKNPYPAWSQANVKLDDVPSGGRTASPSARFREQKQYYPTALELGPLVVDQEGLFNTEYFSAESELSDTDDNFEYDYGFDAKSLSASQ